MTGSRAGSALPRRPAVVPPGLPGAASAPECTLEVRGAAQCQQEQGGAAQYTGAQYQQLEAAAAAALAGLQGRVAELEAAAAATQQRHAGELAGLQVGAGRRLWVAFRKRLARGAGPVSCRCPQAGRQALSLLAAAASCSCPEGAACVQL